MFLLSAAFSAACTGASADAAPVGGGADAGAAGASGDEPEPQSIELSFDPAGTITLSPKEPQVLTVRATLLDHTTPASQIWIRFALLGGDDAADAVLDATDVQTDAQGIAHVLLTAPSQPTTFSVRASNPRGQVAQQGVIVTAQQVTRLVVQPSYAGHRSLTRWTASARPGVSCADLVGNPPPDGDHPKSANPRAQLVLDRVPVGIDLAVTVRAGHYISGCVNLPPLSEVEGNQVLVFASDRPLNLAATNLSLSLGATDAHPAFDKLLQGSIAVAEAALLGNAKNDIAALLDGMHEATTANYRDAFDAARDTHDWDGALDSAFGKSAARRLRDPAERWLTAGLSALNAPNALIGELSPANVGATFKPSAVGSATPVDSGLVGPFATTWSADSNDTLLIGMGLTLQPGRLLTALAVAPARAEFPEAMSVERALALAVNCTQIGQVLLDVGETADQTAFTGCDQSCAVNLCESAVTAAWSRAQLSSGAELATLSITATGTAEIGDDARATGLSGRWVGQLQTSTGSATVSGALEASSSAD